MDRTPDDAPIAWAALIVIQRGWGPTPDGTAEAFADAIAAVAGRAATQIADPGPGPWEQPEPGGWVAHPGINGSLGFGEIARSRFTVHAATRDQAWQRVRAHGEAALGRSLTRSDGRGCDLDSIVVYPEGSDLARWNCSLGGDAAIDAARPVDPPG